MMTRTYETREIRAFNSRSTSPVLPMFQRSPLNYPHVPSVYENKSGFRCNRYLGLFHKLYREFHATLPNAEKQGFIDTFHRKSGGIGLFRDSWNGRSETSVFSLSYSFGHTYLSIGGCTVLRIENGVTRYLSDDGEVIEVPYSGEAVPSPVLRRFRAFLQIARKLECSFKGMPEAPYVPDYSIVAWWYGDKPEFKPMTSRTTTVSLKVLGSGKARYSWAIRLKDSGNTNYFKDDNGCFPKAYKVEINGTVAWLPHSILGERYEALRSGTIEVPTWWLKKNNITVK